MKKALITILVLFTAIITAYNSPTYAQACPIDTDLEFTNEAECNARCYTNDGQKGTCEGPDNKCCNFPTVIAQTCPDGSHDYGQQCATACNTNCIGPNLNCCVDEACPSDTDLEFTNGAECNARCYTNDGQQGTCEGPDDKCCNLSKIIDDDDIGGAGDPVTRDTLNSLNPLIQQNSGDEPSLPTELSTPGGIVSRFLGKFAFPIAGLILFVMLVWGGFEMMAGATTKKSLDAGKQRVAAALGGFLLLFASYWIAKILEMMFGIKIL
ncbi:pilin [Patescibacteria group bacterium]|nr:pilin [Patescibacteria group bacterium]MBU1885495.1 pilin [Patescibacteria group bacterium]